MRNPRKHYVTETKIIKVLIYTCKAFKAQYMEFSVTELFMYL